MKLPRDNFCSWPRGRCHAAGRLTLRLGASLSDAAGAHHCRICTRRRVRHRRAAAGL